MEETAQALPQDKEVNVCIQLYVYLVVISVLTVQLVLFALVLILPIRQ